MKISILHSQELSSHTQRHRLSFSDSKQTSYSWVSPNSCPFDELLISWNADRPLKGHYVILSSVLIQNQWTPWLLYAVWGSHDQYSFHDTTLHAPVHSFQDQVEILEGEATGFRIRIEACGGATLDRFYTLYASISIVKLIKPIWSPPPHSYFPSSPMPGISQLCLPHPRAKSLCSPTSTTALIRHALNQHSLNPLHFAERIYDAGFDIYGNWSFNIAQAFVELGIQWQCFCARLTRFAQLWDSLPIIASIKGSLRGSMTKYSQGHLIVIEGYDREKREFLCMDPAFPSDEQTTVAYQEEELKQAWENRGYLAYFIRPLV